MALPIPSAAPSRRARRWRCNPKGRNRVAGDDLTRVQPDSQPQVDAVTRLGSAASSAASSWMSKRRQTRAKSVVLQSDWRPEQSHDAVAGELVDGAAVPLHHRGGPVEHVGHDVAQTFGVEAAARSIERTTSANSTVTCLYSADAEGLAIAAPQPSQNRAPRRGSVPQVPQTRSVPPMRCDLPRSRMASGAVAQRLVHASGNITVRRARRACPPAVRRRRRPRPRACRAGRTAPR